MASSEVDQKFLCHFATRTGETNPFLSGMLYKILGLSVILSKKLLRARKLRRLDPTRETKSFQLYHHILWLSREGLIIVEQYVHPMVTDYVELRVLAYKLQASFYHIFVLFHNQPRVYHRGIQTLPGSASYVDIVNATTPANRQNGGNVPDSSTKPAPMPSPPPEGGPVGSGSQMQPPGLECPVLPKFAASFILPAIDYTPRATECFTYVAALSDQLLPGSHPIRLSVKLEYAAYLYDCLNDSTACRRVAKQAIADVYNAQEGMDDESFEDAAELVSVLGKMVKRGGKTTSSAGGSSTGGAGDKSFSDASQGTPSRDAGAVDLSGTPKHRKPQPKQQQPTTPQRPIPTSRGTPSNIPADAGLGLAIPPPTVTNPYEASHAGQTEPL
ncbi:uncharacterized protein GIQ15_05536 [Arthroderma uncinatum]|uniref:uncharacterized protein n=1 Tax=Arthroderma uncinatum TaxID=74035 RepID=UPI00144A9BD0|nr:uncharacterized protein GIQ15_05536 [Arthroderma uncinatum]KAF3480189.1 hypothetical protein GIQ15_05536 [Arthroderma uncinatum]